MAQMVMSAGEEQRLARLRSLSLLPLNERAGRDAGAVVAPDLDQDLSQDLAQSMPADLRAGMEAAADMARQVTGAAAALVSLVDAEWIWPLARRGAAPRHRLRRAGLCAHTIQRPDRVLVVQDALSDHRFAGDALVAGPPHFRSYAGVPLCAGAARPHLAVGALSVLDTRPAALDASAVNRLRMIGQMLDSQLCLRREASLAWQAARRDALTGIGNTLALEEAIGRSDGAFALMLIDLPGLAAVGDRLGQGAADAVVARVADILARSMRDEHPARIGAHRFGLLIEGDDSAAASARAVRLRRAIEGLSELSDAGTRSPAALGFPLRAAVAITRFANLASAVAAAAPPASAAISVSSAPTDGTDAGTARQGGAALDLAQATLCQARRDPRVIVTRQLGSRTERVRGRADIAA